MIGRDLNKSSHLSVLAGIALACAILPGCGQSSRNFVARLSGATSEIGHTLARPALRVMPGGADDAPASAESNPHLIRDPFLAPASDESVAPAGGHSHRRLADVPSAVEAPRREAGQSSGPAIRDADRLAYLDRELERVAAAMQEAGARRVRSAPEWARQGAPLDAAAERTSEPGSAELHSRFDELASREAAPRSVELSRFSAQASSVGGGGSVPEDLASSPDPGESHLSMIVDSDRLPARFREWSQAGNRETTIGSRPASVLPDVASEPPQQPRIPARPTAGGEFDVRRAMLEAGTDTRPVAPPAPPIMAFEGEGTTEMPPIELAISVDAPGPAAPHLDASVSAGFGPRTSGWRGHADRNGSAAINSAESAPRALPEINFARRATPVREPVLSRFRGPLAIGLSLLLVLFAAAAFRRHVATRDA